MRSKFNISETLYIDTLQEKFEKLLVNMWHVKS